MDIETRQLRRQEQALKLIEKLAKLTLDDEGALNRVLSIKRRITTPMSVILEKVPGNSVASKARFLKVARPSYYDWLNGTSRPGNKMAKKLAAVTGFSVAEIRGLDPAV